MVLGGCRSFLLLVTTFIIITVKLYWLNPSVLQGLIFRKALNLETRNSLNKRYP